MSDKLTTERVNTVAVRLLELSDAVSRHDMSQFTMRIPAEEDRDADLVLSEASRTMRRLRAHLSDSEATMQKEIAERDEQLAVLRAELAAWENDPIIASGVANLTAQYEAQLAAERAEVEGLREAVSILAWELCPDCGGLGETWENGGEDDPIQVQCQPCWGLGMVPPSNRNEVIEQLMREGVVVRALAAEHERQGGEEGQG